MNESRESAAASPEPSAEPWQSRPLRNVQPPSGPEPRRSSKGRLLVVLVALLILLVAALATVWLTGVRDLRRMRAERDAALAAVSDAGSRVDDRLAAQRRQLESDLGDLREQLARWRGPLDQARQIHLEPSSPLGGRAGEEPAFELDGEALRTTFVLHPEGELPPPPYTVRLVTGARRELWRLESVGADEFGQIVVSVATAELPTGRLRLELLQPVAGNERERVLATFPFRHRPSVAVEPSLDPEEPESG